MKKKFNGDLTIIYITANKIDGYFGENVRDQLVKIADNLPIISVSWEPMDFGQNHVYGTPEKPSTWHIYKQVLEGAKLAQTKYIGIAEDDVLYSPDHYFSYRPEDNEFAYNVCKWGVYTWTQPPVFSFTRRKNNTSLIAPRKALIETLEERFEKYPDPNDYPLKWWAEPGRYEKPLGLKTFKVVEYWSGYPNIVFSHEKALGYNNLGSRKRLGRMKAYETVYWGHVEDVLKLWKDEK
jgi:hypothetical protein